MYVGLYVGYLLTDLSEQYTVLPIDIIPQEIIAEYQLKYKVKMVSSSVKSDKVCMDFHRK